MPRDQRDADFLAEASTLLASSLDYDETLRRLARLAIGRLADWCVLDIVDHAGHLRRVATAHVDPARATLVSELMHFAPGEMLQNPVDDVLRTGRPASATRVTPDDLKRAAPSPEYFAVIEALGVAACLLVPIVARGRTLGALSLARATVGQAYDASDVTLAEELAQRAAAALDNARLFRESDARRREAEALLEVSRLILATLDPDATGRRIVESVQQLTGSSMAVLYRVDEASGGDLHLVAGTGARVDWNQVLRRGTATVGLAVRQRTPIATSDLLADPRIDFTPAARDRIERSGYHAVLATPLLVQDRVIGALAVGDERGRVFSSDDVRLVQTFAHQAALALENARLYAEERTARSEAENANRMKDEFLAMLSHELRTPLTSIVGWTGLLRSGQLDAVSAERALETIERNARLQTQLVEDLLDVSAIITGKFRLELRPVELGRVVDEAVESMRSAAAAKGLTLEWQVGIGVGVVRGDPDRLQQVVWNLLSNAIKFTPSGGRVHAELSGVDGRARLVVSDTGRGISPEFLPYVFDHFRQGEATTTRTHRGLGLGLAIVRHLVELHGGDVRAEARATGRAPRSPSSCRSRPRSRRRGSRPPPAGSTRCRCWTASPSSSSTTSRTRVRCYGRSSRSAGRTSPWPPAREARETLARSQARIVVSDIMMPGEDGYDLVGWLRHHDVGRNTRTPAIALTAYASAHDRERVLAAGFDLHVAKPVEPRELVEAVAALVAGG